MIPIDEFLTLRAPALDKKILREWQHDSDEDFVNYVLQHHAEFDYQHLRGALRILQNVNSSGVRELYKSYSNHFDAGYRTIAIGSLQVQHERGWDNDVVAVH